MPTHLPAAWVDLVLQVSAPPPRPFPASGHSLPSVFQLKEQSVVSRLLCLLGGQVQLLRPPAALLPVRL